VSFLPLNNTTSGAYIPRAKQEGADTVYVFLILITRVSSTRLTVAMPTVDELAVKVEQSLSLRETGKHRAKWRAWLFRDFNCHAFGMLFLNKNELYLWEGDGYSLGKLWKLYNYGYAQSQGSSKENFEWFELTIV
jgi:hypothetical protein